MRKRLLGLMLGAFGFAALLFAEPAVRTDQYAAADAWQQYWGTEGITCEGCRGVGFCCSISSRCKIIVN